METILLNISAGSGPEECAKMASLTLQEIQREIQEKPELGIKLSILETCPAYEKGNIRSALLKLEPSANFKIEASRAEQNLKNFAHSWTGVIQWIWQSTYRPHHKRKNWFVQVSIHNDAAHHAANYPALDNLFSAADVRFETAKAGGPGGQHVNKTETAVRAVHIPTGKSAVAKGERSQFINKRDALKRLLSIFEEENTDRQKKSRSDLRHSHWELERGNPIRVYDGETLKLKRIKNG